MKKWFCASIKVISLILIGFLIGAIFGFKEGFHTFYQYDSIPRGVLAVTQLKALDRNDQRPVRDFLEMDINQSLYMYSLSVDEWWYNQYIMEFLGASPSKFEDYVKRVARYRINNPGPKDDPTLFDVVPPDKHEYADEYKNLAKSHRDRITRIKEVILTHSGS